MPVRRHQFVVALLSLAIGALVWHSATASDSRKALARLVRELGPLPNDAVLAGMSAEEGGALVARRLEDWPPAAAEIVASLPLRDRSRDEIRLYTAVDLYRGRPSAAVARLEQALRGRPRDAVLLNDLSAAYIVLAHHSPGSAALYLSRAVERAAEAAERRGSWREPDDNRRAAFRALGLHEQAGVVRVVSRSATRTEAGGSAGHNRDCADLNAQPAQTMRERFETTLTAQWAAAVRANAGGASRELDLLTCLAAAREMAVGDRLFSAAIDTIRRASAAGRRALAAAHLAYVHGRRLYDSGQREAALQQFQVAEAALRAHGSAFAEEAAMQRLVVSYQFRQIGPVIREASQLRQRAIERGYPTVAARAAWVLGLARMQRGEIDEAITAYEDARRDYMRIGEPETAATVANTAADTLRLSGDTSRSWSLLTAAVSSLPATSAQRRYLILFNLSLHAQDDGLWRAAAAFLGGALAAADERGHILTMVEARLRRAELNLKRALRREAIDDLTSARTLVAHVTSPKSHAYLTAWIDRVAASLDEHRDPRGAARTFEELAARFAATEPAEVPSLYLQAGQAARAAGDVGRAAALFRRGIGVAVERRGLLRSEEFRLSHFSTDWDLYHELIGVELARDPAAALRVADDARAALASPHPGNSIIADRPQSLLVEGEAVLYYAALPQRLVVWTVTPAGITVRNVDYPAALLAADVAAFREAIAAADDKSRASLGSALFDRVLAPGLQGATGARRLLLAADGPLGDLPFALLTDATGRFAVERFELAQIPALSALTHEQIRPPSSVLAIGYNGRAGDRVRLQAAEAEAQTVAVGYADALALVGSDATPEAFAARVASRDVIHVAAHAEAHRLAPWLSHVRLAPSANAAGSGTLRFEQVASWDLRQTRLVVLSACDTAAGSQIRAFGTVNLAAPFLTAGAAAVVGTLWRIDDRASALFMQLFHRSVAAGVHPAEALRQAQLEALRSPDRSLASLAVWGAWVVHTRELPARRP
jgi:CHAT domain-containing protein/tetratricopeptide (TPR) repeat protein